MSLLNDISLVSATPCRAIAARQRNTEIVRNIKGCSDRKQKETPASPFVQCHDGERTRTVLVDQRENSITM